MISLAGYFFINIVSGSLRRTGLRDSQNTVRKGSSFGVATCSLFPCAKSTSAESVIHATPSVSAEAESRTTGVL